MVWDKGERNYVTKDQVITLHGPKINLEQMIMEHQVINYMDIILCG